jgi:hypothetical protein
VPSKPARWHQESSAKLAVELVDAQVWMRCKCRESASSRRRRRRTSCPARGSRPFHAPHAALEESCGVSTRPSMKDASSCFCWIELSIELHHRGGLQVPKDADCQRQHVLSGVQLRFISFQSCRLPPIVAGTKRLILHLGMS